MPVREKTCPVFRKRFFRQNLTCKKSNISTNSKRFVMAERIRYDVCDRVATVPWHRPDKRNALHHRLVAEHKGALAEAAVRVVVLTGAGKISEPTSTPKPRITTLRATCRAKASLWRKETRGASSLSAARSRVGRG